MNITLASFNSLPRSVGGGEVHLYQLACALKDAGHQPSILTVENAGSSEVSVRSDEFGGIPIHYLTVPSLKTIYTRDTRLISWARNWFTQQQTDVLHMFLFGHMLGLVNAANEMDIPVCLTALEFSYFCRRYDLMYEGNQLCALDRRGVVCEQCVLTRYSRKQRTLAAATRLLPVSYEGRIHERALTVFGEDRFVALGQRAISSEIEAQREAFDHEIAAVITPSSLMREFYIAQGVTPSKLHYIPYGTDVGAPINRAPLIPADNSQTLRVGYIGRLDPKKGVDVLCEAVLMLPNDLLVQLRIFGPLENSAPDYLEKIRSYTRRDSRIEFRGKLERDAIADAYREIDILVVPSIWYENSPIAISEALAFRCPVICSESAGITDLIQNGVNGLTYPSGDSVALADCLRRVVNNRELISELRNRIQHIQTTNEVAERILHLYRDILRMTAIQKSISYQTAFQSSFSESTETLSKR